MPTPDDMGYMRVSQAALWRRSDRVLFDSTRTLARRAHHDLGAQGHVSSLSVERRLPCRSQSEIVDLPRRFDCIGGGHLRKERTVQSERL